MCALVLACWAWVQSPCPAVVWDDSLGMCYAEAETEGEPVCVEMRTYM